LTSSRDSENGDDADFIRLSKRHTIANSANRLILSPAYVIFYIFMIVLNVTLVLWIVIHASILRRISTPGHWTFITLEFLINIFFFFEVVVRILSFGKKYLQQWTNVFDVVVLALSLAGLVIYFATNGILEEADDITTTLLLVLRYAIQFLRLIIMVKNHHRILRSYNNSSQIDFSTLTTEPGLIVVHPTEEDASLLGTDPREAKL